MSWSTAQAQPWLGQIGKTEKKARSGSLLMAAGIGGGIGMKAVGGIAGVAGVGSGCRIQNSYVGSGCRKQKTYNGHLGFIKYLPPPPPPN